MVGVCEFKDSLGEGEKEGEKERERPRPCFKIKFKKLKKKQHVLDPLKYTLRSRISI